MATRENPQPGVGIVRVADGRGRRLGFKRPTILDRLRLFELIGGESAENPAYLGVAGTAFCLVEIDGEPLAPANSRRELETRAIMIGDEGFLAAGRVVAEQFTAPGPDERQEAQAEVLRSPP